jgi:hypothetical protein
MTRQMHALRAARLRLAETLFWRVDGGWAGVAHIMLADAGSDIARQCGVPRGIAALASQRMREAVLWGAR